MNLAIMNPPILPMSKQINANFIACPKHPLRNPFVSSFLNMSEIGLSYMKLFVFNRLYEYQSKKLQSILKFYLIAQFHGLPQSIH